MHQRHLLANLLVERARQWIITIDRIRVLIWMIPMSIISK
jgi:hypothetical protein